MFCICCVIFLCKFNSTVCGKVVMAFEDKMLKVLLVMYLIVFTYIMCWWDFVVVACFSVIFISLFLFVDERGCFTAVKVYA